MAKQIIITSDLDTGKTEVEAEGFTRSDGKGCADATKFIEDVLGEPDGDRDWKPEAGGGGKAQATVNA